MKRDYEERPQVPVQRGPINPNYQPQKMKTHTQRELQRMGELAMLRHMRTLDFETPAQ